MSYKVEIVETNNKLEISSSVNEQAPTLDIIQEASSVINVVHDVALLPSDFNDNTENIIKSFLRSGYGVSLFPSGDYFIVQTSGLQPSGNYSLNGHNHVSLDITDFNSSVSGLLPVKNIISGSGISVSSNNSVFTVAVTGQFGLTAEQVDDRVSSLLSSGYGINLSYDDNNNILTISTVGLQPTGNYSVVGHTHLSSNITDFVSAASGAAPVQTVAGKTGNVILNKNDVGLNNVDNTSDLNKPISSATQNALNLKSDVGHVHNSSNITDFVSSVSGLLPVKNIFSGSGISVTSSGADFTVAVTGQFGLTAEQVDDRVSNLLVAGNYINLNYNDSIDSLTVSVTGVQPSGNYSIVGHSHTIGDVSGLQNSLDSKQPSGNYSIAGHSHNSSDITNFNTSVSGLLPVKNITNGSYVNISNSSGNFIVSVTGLQPSGNYANAIHNHSSSQITDFNSSVSGLLPITNVLAGTNISVVPSGTSYTISVSGQLGLTSEEVDDRVAALLNAGNGININYNDPLDTLTISTTGLQPSGDYANTVHSHVYTDITNFSSGVADNLTTTLLPGSFINLDYNSTLDTLTISTSGLQPSGNYSIVGHSHTSSDITNFNSSVSGLLPSVSGSGYISSNFNNNIYTISVSGLQPSGNYSLVGHTHTSSEITDFNSSVSGLLPVKDILAGTYIDITSSSGIYTINSTGEANLLETNVFNKTGSPIPKLSVVYINGGQGDQPTIALASASGEMASSKTYGITAENIGNMSAGKVIVAGALIGVNTDQFNPTAPQGDINGITLWLSPTTPGGLTTTKPTAPYHMVSVGTVVRTHQNEGVIEVRIQNGFELEELHNVAISGLNDNQFIKYDSSTSLWKNVTATASDISNFNSSVSGLLPVTNILGGTNISVVPSGTVYTVSVSGQLGLTAEEVDDRVGNLLVAGSGISLDYNDGSDTLTIHNTSISPDEIEEYAATVNFPASGNINILYRTTDDGRIYQWSGSAYAEIGPDSVTTGSHASQHYTNGSDPILNVVSRPATLTATVNNYAHNNADIIYLNADANRIITGLAAATDGSVKLLINSSLYTITLDNQDTNSNPENRFMVPFGSDYVLQPGYSITIVYDSNALRWRILA